MGKAAFRSERKIARLGKRIKTVGSPASKNKGEGSFHVVLQLPGERRSSAWAWGVLGGDLHRTLRVLQFLGTLGRQRVSFRLYRSPRREPQKESIIGTHLPLLCTGVTGLGKPQSLEELRRTRWMGWPFGERILQREEREVGKTMFPTA